MSQRPSVIRQTIITPIVLIVALLIMAALSYQFGSRAFNRTVVEMFINIMVVVGLYVFVGNSGLLSFGHISFMCLGAYMTAWLTIPPVMKSITLKGLPAWLLHTQLPMWVATPISGLIAALFALIVGRVIMRLSGIAASIATFGLLGVINNVYSNWDSVTGGQGSIVGIPPTMNVWTGWIGGAVAIAIAYLYSISRSGLALRATRDEAVAASASGIDIVRERLIAFVVSAFIIGLAGALYAHFLSIVNPGAFYLRTTFITLSMLVVGGMYSLSGAVSGVVAISVLIELFRNLEKGISLGGHTVGLPNGVQEIAIGIITIAILMYLPTGLTRNQEFSWRRWPLQRRLTPPVQTALKELH
ncbi:branched-chain amino acid ABC transporter permease [Bradyrhizobium brasilense]|uniref:Amino acid/amide ABC transporter membrane protein 2, HAAT family n=1 Tax=Bradyrhizobium brasilense TaxID=1419277 RepID=A0A1G6ZXS8_9BRAD|nr:MULTISPECIES: branched-chain amino acid ABC transporter permease [Bradyrhizobium]MCC8975340.1 branched-chain amino acid ABC transporter permease [Bradyrhizobium brasilense]WFU30114.1 branched-chain amino acid ABC transporter permease [Bradyrhizobium australafricanum]SDE07468.1 amino acid/amide ABC transporter membrane protein 2, HAAT family [Bradyrhizobium brasilense]